MLKKIVSLVVGATLVLATLGVSAATIGTVSVYDATQENITVTTTVEGAAANDVYTYLAYKKGANRESLVGNDVVYADEKTSVAGEDVVFTYVTAAANNEAVVLVGGAGSTEGAANEGEISAANPVVNRNYTVAVNGGSPVDGSIAITSDMDDDDLIDITADVANAVITSVTINGAPFNTYFATNTGIKVPLGAITDDAAIVINTTVGATASAVYIFNGAYIENDTEDENGYASVIAVASVVGYAEEYGIEFSTDADFTEGNVIKAEALGKGTNGMYAIKLYGYELYQDGILNGADVVYARAYADDIISTDVQEIAIGEIAE